MANKGRRQDSWQPPEAWDCPPGDMVHSKPPPLRCPDTPVRRSKNKKHTPTSELTHLRKNLRRMEAASHKIVVERLKEEWIEIADASVYRELELEKQLWMLSALRMLEKKHTTGEQSSLIIHSPSPAKILSLYENQGKYRNV